MTDPGTEQSLSIKTEELIAAKTELKQSIKRETGVSNPLCEYLSILKSLILNKRRLNEL